MSTTVVRRQPRRPAPPIPGGEVRLEPPPAVPPESDGRWQRALVLLPVLCGGVAMAMLVGRGGGAYAYVAGGLFGLSTLAMLVTARAGGSPRRGELAAARREYLRRLAALRREVRGTARAQRVGQLYRHPDPDRLWSTADSHRLWERRRGDADFGVVRVGLGPQTLATPLVAPPPGPGEPEPTAAGALRRFLATYAVVPDLPVAVALRGFGRVHLHGGAGAEPAPAALALARAVLAQLAVFHAPDDLVVAVCAGPGRAAEWDWVKWLPHARHPRATDALGPLRLVAPTAAGLERLLGDVLGARPPHGRPAPAPTGGPYAAAPGPHAATTPGGPFTAAAGGPFGAAPGGAFGAAGAGPAGPHVVVVLDGGDTAGAALLGAEPAAGVTVLDLDHPAPARPGRGVLALAVGPGGALRTATRDGAADAGTADALDPVSAGALARLLAPRRLAAAAAPGAEPLAGAPGLPDLLGIDPDGFDPPAAWPARPARDHLRAPIGVGTDGGGVELDLKESALDGMGPHGLVVGATGSGKSELLRTLVLALAVRHSSEELNFVLVDFKGGATFASLDRLPHTAAVITNLADELPLVDRMVDALNGELVRRQELLRRSGNQPSVRAYERARAGGAPLAPLPTLLLVCDEFSELLSAKPEFIDLFVQIGRVGRSLGVHLLLASQRLEEGRLRGLDTHLSYRIGLRTFSSLESRTVLGVPDAFALPRSPGHGYLRAGTDPLVRFRAAYVSGPYARPRPPGAAPGEPPRALAYTTEAAPAPPGAAAPPAAPAGSLLDLLVDRMVGQGPPAHQVWLPPLSAAPAFDEILGPLRVDPDRGLAVANPQLHGALQVPVAVVDRPYEQRRDLLWLALDGAAGHVAVVGGPQAGKSHALRALVCGLALTHTPREAQVYCLDFGGGTLAPLAGLPHVGGVAGRADAPAVRRTVGELAALLAARERRFAASGVDSMRAYRAARPDDDPYGDVFLVVDGWATLRAEYPDLEPAIADLAARGLSYGVHVVASALRWAEFRAGLRELFGSRVELRLGDPADSLVSRRAAGNVPAGAPGRGVTAEGLHLRTVRPEVTALGPDPAALPAAVAAQWAGPAAPAVRLLPTLVPYGELAGAAGTGWAVPVGVAEADLRPATVDFAAEPHFLVFGDAGAGKSSFLRGLATTLVRRYPPEAARLVLVDYRRSLLGAITSEHLIGYGSTAERTAELVDSVAGYMRRRLPGPDVTAAQLRDRSWWTGPDCFVLVDDYDLVAGGPTNPLLPLLDFLPRARDIGLHLVLARRSGGAARAQFEPVIQRLRELSSPGLVMSGDRGEGELLGSVRPGPLPPGRGWLVTRQRGAALIQVGYLPPY
ncbi:hypothetical protein GCM10010123_28970 [Pilimelia anulata]|uniref:FtsK domain-containing protein n=1 Tax=Pilimelia anulata TaxID=53371 RepID=A0A8J3B6I2_9ACTN|nr:type VII secretion protein EccCa [Pilimelia anulata]GGJ97177.1 hypothetical protein GCM10010123_28970 [Pilimelia anulata]